MKIITAKEIKNPITIAIVVSRFNEEITHRLCEGTLQRLKELDIPNEAITVVWVPGAVEIPIVAKRLALRNYFSGIIALGAVIRGETGHYDYVCKQVSDGCQEVAMAFNLPVIFGVLTTENKEQAIARTSDENHKGREAADAALEMISVLQQVDLALF